MKPKRKQGEESKLQHEMASAYWKDVHEGIAESSKEDRDV